MSESPPGEAAAAPDARVGTVVQGRYKIVRKVGEGGMGSVYEGARIADGARVALKFLHAQHMGNAETVARFQREAAAAQAIRSDHVIEVIDVGRADDGAVYMVLEFLDGRDFAEELKARGPLPLGEAVHVVSQVCDALSAAHARGVVHRDLKPANIFLVERGGDARFVKLLDFGVSKFQDSLEGAGGSMTRTGTMVGTPFYMSPEQAEGRRDIDRRADVYALGVILFHALTLRFPFEDPSYPALLLKICVAEPAVLREFRRDLPDGVQQAVSRMLKKRRDERFADCAEVKAALEPFRGVASRPDVEDTFVDAPTAVAQVLGTGSSISAISSVRVLPGAEPSRPANAAASENANANANASVPQSQVVTVPPGSTQLRAPAPPPAPHAGTEMKTPGPAVTDAPARSGASGQRRTPLWWAALALGVLLVSAAIAGGAGAFRGTEARGAGAPNSVHVRITSDPEDAELYLDGHRVANPFDGDLPASVQTRRIEARMPGYAPAVQELSLQFPQTVRVRLHRAEPGATAP